MGGYKSIGKKMKNILCVRYPLMEGAFTTYPFLSSCLYGIRPEMA